MCVSVSGPMPSAWCLVPGVAQMDCDVSVPRDGAAWPGRECRAGNNWDGDGLELHGAGTKDKQN